MTAAIEGKTFNDRKEIAEAIDAVIRHTEMAALRSKTGEGTVAFSVNGMPVQARSSRFNASSPMHAELRMFSPTDPAVALRHSDLKTGTGALQSISALARNYGSRLGEEERESADRQKQISELEKAMGDKWDSQEAYETKIAELKRIEDSLLGVKEEEAEPGEQTALAAQPTENPLFEQGLPLATQIANRYNNIRGVEPGDVLSRARSALARAAEKFDPARGAFLPFARTAINNELRGMYRRGARNLEDTTLDAPANDEARMTNAERLAAPSDTRSEVELAESRSVLDSAVAELPARMQGAITGILDGDTLEAIGERLGGISRQAVGRLASEAMRRLRGKLGERGITSARDLLAQAITPDGNGAGADAKLAIVEAHVADALKAQASIDPLQQLIDSLDADALDTLFEKAIAEERGQYSIGRPDLAMGADDNAVRRATDQYYTDLFKSKTRATMAEEADQILANRGVTGFAQEIAHRWLNGDSLRDGEVMAAKTVLAELSRHTDTPEGIKRMMAAGFAYRNIRGVAARSLAAGFDPHKTPEERNREFIAKAISTLPKKTENAIEAEKDPDKKRSLLDAAMKERLTQLEKAFAYISKGGLTLEDVLGGGWELHGKGVKLIEGEMAGYDVPHQKALKLAQTGARSAKEIAQATGLSEAEVERVNDQFISSLRDKLRDKVRAGLTLEKIDLQGALFAQETAPEGEGGKTDAEVNAELERIIKGMGFVASKDLGKFKVVKRKRSKLFVPPAVPYTGRVPDDSPVPFEERRQNQIPFKPGDEMRNVNPKPGDQVVEPTGRVLGQIGLPLYQEMMVRKGADMGSVDDVVKIARVAQAANGNRADMIFEAWVASILSGPTTHAAYKMALAANAGFEFSIQRGVEALVNLAYRDKDSATFGEFKHILKGVLPGVVKGITLGARQWNTESELFHHEVMNSQVEMFDEMPATGYQRAPAISERPVEQFFGPAAGKVDDALSKLGRANPVRGRVVRIPFRALYFIDGFYKMANAQMGVMQFAYRIAKAEGLKGDALSGRINELVATPGSPAWLKAADMAEWLTFRSRIPTKEQGGNWIDNAVAQIARARNKSHAIGSQIPFVQLPYNIVKVGFSKAFAPAITAYKFAKAGAQALPRPEYDPEEGAFKMKDGKPFFESYSKAAQVRDVATSLIALGTMTAIWNMVAGDGDDDDKQVLITGSTPYTQLKRGVRELQQRSYGGPYVLRIGGRSGFHFNFGKYEPFATVLGTLADTVIQLKHLVRGQESPKEAMDALAGYFIAQAQEKTFLRGLDNLSKTLSGDMGMTEFAANLVLQGLVPALIRQPLRNLDDYMPNWKESGGMYRLLPAAGFRQPKIDVYGHPVEKTGNWFTRMFAPNSAKPAEHLQKADALLLRWNNEHPRDVHAPSAPTTTYTDGAGKTQPMTPEQSTKYLTATGHRFEQMLRGQISQHQIEHPTEEDVKLIENLHKAAAEQIKREMFPKTAAPPTKHASSVNLIKAWRREPTAA
jgi:RNA polymerase sigma factor (sigma-70 family)